MATKCGIFFFAGRVALTRAPQKPVGGEVVAESSVLGTNGYCSRCQEPRSLCRCPQAAAAASSSPPPARRSARDESDASYTYVPSSKARAEVEAAPQTSSGSFCSSCCEPLAFCRCAKTTTSRETAAVPTSASNARLQSDASYNYVPSSKARAEVEAAPQTSSGSFCSSCCEPLAFCRCAKAAASRQTTDEAPVYNNRARELSDSAYREPVRGVRAQAEVVQEASHSVKAFCTSCGEPASLCRCAAIAEGRQIYNHELGKFI